MTETRIVSPELVAALCAGDEAATEAFVRHFWPRLERLARVRGFSAPDAEEVAQDTLTAVIAQLRVGRFERRSQMATWVHAIFERRAIDHHRRNSSWVSRAAHFDDTTDAGACELVSREDTAMVLRVQDALARLDPLLRVVLLLNAREGYTASEIARMLRRHPKVVEPLVTAARKAFVEAYTGEAAQPRRASRRSPRLTGSAS